MKTITIMPRRAGKTVKLLQEFREHLASGKDGVFVTISQINADAIKIENPDIREYIYSSERFLDYGFGYGRLNSKKKLFLDEYLFYRDKVKVELYNYRHYDITVYTTSNKLYFNKIVDFIYFVKKNNINYTDAKGAFKCMFAGDVFDDYYYNFITDPDCVVKCNGLKSKWLEVLGSERFDSEILGEWLE